MATVLERFEAKVQRTAGCWLWTAGHTPTGYGQFHVSGRGSKRVRTYAHRMAYELFVGPIPPGLEIDHVCRNKGCVRPDHLEAVTHQENQRRAGPYRPTQLDMGPTCPSGHLRSAWGYLNRNGHQVCRLCHRQAVRRHRQAARSAAA